MRSGRSKRTVKPVHANDRLDALVSGKTEAAALPARGLLKEKPRYADVVRGK
jgi:hypothetical protein